MKKLILVSLAVIMAVAQGHAQTDSTLYVKQFPGANVGAKVTAAMGACTTNTSIPCYLIIDPSLAVFAAGTLPSMCSNCHLVDFRTGSPWGGGATPLTGVGAPTAPCSSSANKGVFYLSDDFKLYLCSDPANTGTYEWNGVVATTTSGNAIQPGANCVFEGDSITVGFGTTDPPTQNYGAQAMGLPEFSNCAHYYNFAGDGNKVADVQGRYTANVHPLSPTVSGKPGYLWVLIGTNNLGAGDSAATTLSELQTYWSGAIADGWTVIATTITPRNNSTFAWTGANETQRLSLNDSIRSLATVSYSFLDDFAKVLTDPANTTYFVDGLHPTNAGQNVLANSAATLWNSVDTSNGGMGVSVTTAASVNAFLNVNYYNNGSGGVSYLLPSITTTLLGRKSCFRNFTGKADSIDIIPPFSVAVDLGGVSSTAGVSSAGALGDSLCLTAATSTLFMADALKGTWTLTPTSTYQEHDTFSGTSGTSILAHTSDLGHTWASYTALLSGGSVDMLLTGSGSVEAGGSTGGFSFRMNSVVPTTENYKTCATFKQVGSGGANAYLFTRVPSVSVLTNYAAIYVPGTGLGLFAYVAGSASQIGTYYSTSWAVGADHIVCLTVSGSTQTLTDNSATAVTGSDSSVTGAGLAGIGTSSGSTMTVSNFTVQ